MRTLRICTLNTFQVYHTEVLAIVIRFYVTSLVLTYFVTGNLCFLTTFIDFSLPHPSPLVTTDLVFFLWVPFLIDSTCEIIRCCLALNCIQGPFMLQMKGFVPFFVAQYYSIGNIHHNFFTHLLVDGHLGCPCTFAAVNNAAVNMGAQIPLQRSVFVSFRHISRFQFLDHMVVLLLIFWGACILYLLFSW